MRHIEGYSATECYCCGNQGFFPLGTRTEVLSNVKGLYTFTFEDVVCERCDFVFSKKRQEEEGISDYYQFYYPHSSETNEEEHNSRYEYLKKYIEDETVVYEIGGGVNSSFSRFLESKYINITNIEIADRWPSDEMVDLVLCYYLLEHINELGRFLINVNELLKIGGVLIFEVPDFFKNPAASLNEEHVNHFNLISIIAMANRYGFELVSDGFEQGSRSFGSAVILKKEYISKELSRFKFPRRLNRKQSANCSMHRLKAESYYKKCLEYRKCLDIHIEDICRYAKSKNQKILIWGCNQNFVRLLSTIKPLNIHYDVVDGAIQKQALEYFETVILDPKDIILDNYAEVFICATSAYDQIKNLILDTSSLSKECLHRVDFADVKVGT